MTAHERCVERLQLMLRESADQLKKIADRLPEEITSRPLRKYGISITLLEYGQTYPTPMIDITCTWLEKVNNDKENIERTGSGAWSQDP